MTVLITGGAGFIGSHLADRLIARGDSVSVVDNMATGHNININSRVTKPVYMVSIAEYTMLRRIFEEVRPDVVIHAAASYKDPNDWTEDVMTNCLGGANVARLSKEFGVRRVIYFQTSCAYGHNPPETPITTECPINPDTSSYALTKATAEYFLKISGVDYISFRLANCYGERTCTGPIPNFYKKLVAGEVCTVMNTRRDYIYIDDLCAVVMRAIDGEGTKGVYHISTGRDYAIEEIYVAMSRLMGIDQEPIKKEKGPDDTYTLLIDPSKTQRDFPGWIAKTPLEQGLKNTIAYYKTNPPATVFTHLRMPK